MKGIDISNWQGNNIDFVAVKNSGVEVCIIKATESNYFTNQYFDSHTQGALNAGLKVGFYHFFRGSGIAEADYFVNAISKYKDKMAVKPVIDVEVACNDINNQVVAFISRVKEKLGIDCMIYSGAYFAGDNLTDRRLLAYPIWIAHYGVSSPSLRGIWGQGTLAGHQYSESGSIAGIYDNAVDLNNFNDSCLIAKVEKEFDYKGADKMFSENWYLNRYKDVADAVKKGTYKNAYDHYKQRGKIDKPNRLPLPPIPVGYCEGDYLDLNTDVADAVKKGTFTSGVDHYMQFGFAENRKINKNESLEAIKKRIADLEVTMQKIKELVK